ncbi:MAG: DUF72 domain-containing protein [Burkholderiales bacterium]
MKAEGRIRVGMGGWSYAPWRETFYPKDVAQKRELEYASRRVTAIEINATFYRHQKPATFAKWRGETPDDFAFSLKAPRYATTRAVLAEAAPAIERFVDSGIAELGAKLGPLLWQLAPTKRYEPEDIESFLKLLPKEIGGRTARHVLEARHKSFVSELFVDQLRRHGVAPVFTDSEDYASIADCTADFVYARLMRAQASLPSGYPAHEIDSIARRATTWANGSEPEDIPRIGKPGNDVTPRDVYIFFINGAKERAPGAAQALLSRLK